jgi:ubiquinone/menaquinone biosynthesis C-methylase UbiE
MNEVTLSEQLKANYEDYYKEGDSEWRRLGAICKGENIVSLCSDLPRAAMLEIGAGEGSILSRLSELNFCEELYALEISPSGVETIKSKNIPCLVECRTYDGYHIPYENDRFNIAILSHVVEHVEHPRQLLYEASRVAKYIFVEVPLEDTIRLPRDFTFNKVGHINFYSSKTIRRLIQSCNLRVLHQIETNPSKEIYTFQKGYRGLFNYYIKQALLKASPTFATQLFCYHGALVCEKEGRAAVLSQ